MIMSPLLQRQLLTHLHAILSEYPLRANGDECPYNNRMNPSSVQDGQSTETYIKLMSWT